MSVKFWHLPGPARYIERIRHDLLDCRNSLAILSPLTPDGLFDELQRGIEGGSAGYYWQQLYGAPDHRAPAVWLASQFGVDLPTTSGAYEFHELKETMGTVVVMTDLPADPTTLRKWRAFVEQYAQICRSNGGAMSPRFLIRWPATGELPESDLRLVIHPWDGTVDSTDIGLFAALILRRMGHTPFNRNLMAAMAKNLSGGDPLLCRILCSFSLQDLLEPLIILADYANTRGWDAGTPLSFHEGTLVKLDGFEREHPAWLAIHGRDREIGILVWSAQIGILMPLIEERRQEVVEKIGHYLAIPGDQPSYQKVESVEELEIGIIHYQLVNNATPVPKPVKDVVRRLKDVRNNLSHRKALPAGFLDEATIRALTRGV